VSPATLDNVDDGSVVVAEVGGASTFHRVSRNGASAMLEALQPGGGMTLVEDTDTLQIVGCVTGFYRRMDEVGSLNLTQH
jgi:SOS-response transcriptional repressor LexA